LSHLVAVFLSHRVTIPLQGEPPAEGRDGADTEDDVRTSLVLTDPIPEETQHPHARRLVILRYHKAHGCGKLPGAERHTIEEYREKGLRHVDDVVDEVVSLSSTAYDLTPPVTAVAVSHQGMNNASMGIYTSVGDFIAKTYTSLSYDDPASIHYEHRLLTWIAHVGVSFAVPAPIPTRDGVLLCQGMRGHMSLYPRLPGARLNPCDLDQVELLGATCGELHATLQQYPATDRPGRPLFGELFHFPEPERDPFALMPEHLGLPPMSPDDDLLAWWRAEAEKLQAFVAGAYATLPQQTCHNDVTPANVLVDEGRVVGVLDFEFAAPTPRALDVAMGLRMTMRVWEDPEPWETVHRFCQGYRRWGMLTRREVEALPWLIRLRGAITVLWWIRRTAGTGTAGPVPSRIAYLRNVVAWLDLYERRFVDMLIGEVAV